MKSGCVKVYFVFLMLLFSLCLFSGFVVAEEGETSYVTVPVVEGECPPDCWLNNMGGCTCQEDAGADYDSSNEPETTTDDSQYQNEYEKDYYEKYEEHKDSLEFDVKAGTTPDSAFYFFDDFIERTFVGDNPETALKYKEEKIAEAMVMIEEGKPAEASEVLEKALEYSDIIEREVTPELEARVEESSLQVQYVLKEIEDQISGDEWADVKEKFDDNFEKEGKLRTAAEIAVKINELCDELAMLDPIQYEDTCKIDENAPKWRKEKNKELTVEQEKEVKEFGNILSECFKTSGKECRCEDISFYDFSVFCEKMSSLSVECDKGDKNACMEMEQGKIPELPSYLENVFYEIEDKFAEDKYGERMPQECIDASVATPKECMLIMVEFNAPIECRTDIKNGINSGKIKSERDAKDLCAEIMFKERAPKECIDAGATTAKECEKIMFKQSMPKECIDAGFDGTHEGDEKECKEMMKKGAYYGGGGCMNIINEKERLKCFEGAVSVMGDKYGSEYDLQEGGEMTWQCKENRIHWPPDCEKFMKEEWPRMNEQRRLELDKEQQQMQEYKVYRVNQNPCPDGVCDEYERTHYGSCRMDCSESDYVTKPTETCGYGCWWEYDHCQCSDKTYGQQDCGYGCWWNSGSNSCECGQVVETTNNCGYGCWWNGDYCECSGASGQQDCGYGCWWESSMNACKCSSDQMQGQCGSGCSWNGNYCQCEARGCQCSWGWSDNCQCGETNTFVGCVNWATTGQGCNPSTGTCCSSGICSNMNGPGSCVASITGTVCIDNSWTTNAGACDYGYCPNGCTFNSAGCPSGCLTTGGYCGDGVCNVGETSASCSGDCGVTTDTCAQSVYATQYGACDYGYCPNGCTFSYDGCPSGCMTSTTSSCTCADGYWSSDCNCVGHTTTSEGGYCGDGICQSGEYCSQDCETPAPSGCTCADGYWSSDCNCVGHDVVPTGDVCGGCDCSAGCGEGSCMGTDGAVCCSFSPCEEPEPEPPAEELPTGTGEVTGTLEKNWMCENFRWFC